jgi:hypothetical protein
MGDPDIKWNAEHQQNEAIINRILPGAGNGPKSIGESQYGKN